MPGLRWLLMHHPFEQIAEDMTHRFDLATRGLPATERRIELATDPGLVF